MQVLFTNQLQSAQFHPICEVIIYEKQFIPFDKCNSDKMIFKDRH